MIGSRTNTMERYMNRQKPARELISQTEQIFKKNRRITT